MWPARATVGRQPSRCVCNLGGFSCQIVGRAFARSPCNLLRKFARRKKPSALPARSSGPYLPALGVYGFGEIEPVILAALVTGDPLLLIGASGTGKTYLLNSLSEALNLQHRHYNASLISFDDLVGFPYPDPEGTGVRFLETPATVWGAESVLIDEISRSKPEQQNRLFSLVHERRVQGIGLPKLRYRWAAMNPCSTDQDSDENYTGSEPLDPALADRFGLFVNALDWKDLSDEERRRVAEPVGEGRVADDGGALKAQIEAWRSEFGARVGSCPELVLDYVTTAVTALNTAAIRMSPRRSRLLARSLLAATIVDGEPSSRLFRLVLGSSLPHVAWGVQPRTEAVAAAHRAGWDYALRNEERWIHSFMAERDLDRKLGILIERCRDPDAGSQAVAQLLASEPRERAAVFAFATYPAAACGKLPIGAEGTNDLGKVATPILSVDGTIHWQERLNASGTVHPEVERFAEVIGKLTGGRAERARQFFNWCVVERVVVRDPASLERELDNCVALIRAQRAA